MIESNEARACTARAQRAVRFLILLLIPKVVPIIIIEVKAYPHMWSQREVGVSGLSAQFRLDLKILPIHGIGDLAFLDSFIINTLNNAKGVEGGFQIMISGSSPHVACERVVERCVDLQSGSCQVAIFFVNLESEKIKIRQQLLSRRLDGPTLALGDNDQATNLC
eukprot:SAG11_NODE_8438_length_1015_cov_1.516376_2_plen_164_part_01